MKSKVIIFTVVILTVFATTSCMRQMFRTTSTPTNSPITKPAFKTTVDTIQYVFQDGVFVEMELDSKAKPISGNNNYLRGLYHTIKYPALARKNGVEGTCVIKVVVNELGVMESATLYKDIGAGCGEESLRVVKKMGQAGYTAAMKDGVAVKVRFEVPVRFRLH